MNTWLAKNEINIIESRILNLKKEVKDLDSQYNKLQNNYISLLEKTNTQLDLWWTPYWVTFTILSAIIWVWAIFAWVIFYGISSDYKKQQEKFREESNRLIQDTNSKLLNFTEQSSLLVGNFNIEMQEARDQYDNLLKELKEKAKNEEDSEKKKELEMNVKKLERIVIPEPISAIDYIMENIKDSFKLRFESLQNIPSIKHICSSCKTKYDIQNIQNSIIVTYWFYATCPKCKHKDKVFKIKPNYPSNL